MNFKKLQNKLSMVFFFFGLLLLVVLIKKVGWEDVWQQIQKVNYKIIYIFLFPITWYSIQSFAWWRVLTDDGVKVSLIHVFLTKITGEAINTVTPLSFIGGDPYRIYLLQKKTTKTSSASSVVIDRTMYFLGVFILLLLTLCIGWFRLTLPPLWRILFPIFIIGFFIFFVMLVRFQKKGMFTAISQLILKTGIQKERILSYSEKITDLDEKIGSFYTKHKAHFFEIMILHFIGRFLGAVEIFIIASLLGLPLEFVHCLYLASLTILINFLFVFIPGSMGVMESGYGALFYILKINWEHGVALQLVRRIRAFFWIGIGLLIILFYKPSKKA
ncbi:MAG: lysylphosphatidylglycerol synthase transmembrane domain-containing protein [bacterium]